MEVFIFLYFILLVLIVDDSFFFMDSIEVIFCVSVLVISGSKGGVWNVIIWKSSGWDVVIGGNIGNFDFLFFD